MIKNSIKNYFPHNKNANTNAHKIIAKFNILAEELTTTLPV
jgi:hypothetical protein